MRGQLEFESKAPWMQANSWPKIALRAVAASDGFVRLQAPNDALGKSLEQERPREQKDKLELIKM
jgi:hypothetical protein